MELSKEAYQLIVKHTGNKSDLCSLARVSKSFQHAAERALYNTLYMHDPAATASLCDLLTTHDRLSILVEALTVFAEADEGLPDAYWHTLARVLRKTVRLRFFNLHIDGASAHAWILDGCLFRLRTFHCDLEWDTDLISFLNGQHDLDDLYIADFDSHEHPHSPSQSSLDRHSLRALSTLECSFSEAVRALVPGRPVVRLKTCFSRQQVPEKKEELSQLLTSLRQSSAPVRSLDLADSSYTEDFSLTILADIVKWLPDLRYLGTLVLPVGKEVNFLYPVASVYHLFDFFFPTPCAAFFFFAPHSSMKRLQFFGMLMRFPRLRTIELEVTDWDPAPMPQALRALASEIRLYCPSIVCVVFVQDFVRTVVRAVNGICAVDVETNTDILWREV